MGRMKKLTTLTLSAAAVTGILMTVPSGNGTTYAKDSLESGYHDWQHSSCGGGFHFRTCITVHGSGEEVQWIDASYRAWEVNTNWDGHWSFTGEAEASWYGWSGEIPVRYSGFTPGYVNWYLGTTVDRRVPYGSDVCSSLYSLSGPVATACIAVLP